jgi:hypothetical protein
MFQKSSFQKIVFFTPQIGGIYQNPGGVFEKSDFQSFETRIHFNDPKGVSYGSLMVRRYNHSTEKSRFMTVKQAQLFPGHSQATPPATSPDFFLPAFLLRGV